MPGLTPIVVAAITGLISGLALSIPIGPINLTILNEGARRGFKWAALIGLGATTMEVIYCIIAFTSFASFFTQPYVKPAMEWFSFGFMLFIGLKFLLAKSVPRVPRHPGRGSEIRRRLEERVGPESAFLTGLVRVMGNLGVLVFWIFLTLYFISHRWVLPRWPDKLACVAGVAVGTGGWFTGLSWGVSLGHGKLSQKTLLRIEHYSGVILLIIALVHGGIIVWRIVHPD